MSNNPELDRLIKTTVDSIRQISEGLTTLISSRRKIFSFNKETLETIKTLLVVSSNLNLRLQEERDALQEQVNLLLKKAQQ